MFLFESITQACVCTIFVFHPPKIAIISEPFQAAVDSYVTEGLKIKVATF